MTGEDAALAFARLTPREREILRLVAQHRRSKEIARVLNLSPKTVEMHVLSARRRLANLDRRDAALAFVAWEEDPGNDYRKRSPGLFEPDAPVFDEPEQEAHDVADHHPPISAPTHVSGQLGGPGRRADLAGRHPGTVASGAGIGVGAAKSARGGRAAEPPSPANSQRHDLSGGLHRLTRFLDGGWRHDLSPLQLLALAIGLAVVAGLLLGGVIMAAHNFLYALQRWREGWPPPA